MIDNTFWAHVASCWVKFRDPEESKQTQQSIFASVKEKLTKRTREKDILDDIMGDDDDAY